MSNRRGFLREVAGATAGIVFSGCSLLRAAPQSGAAAKRRQVMVGGKRVKTIDVHAHCNVPEAMALMPNPPNGQNLFLPPERVPERLALMDQQGTDVEALSINPFWYGVDRDLARQIIKIQNEKLAELCAAHPDRFVAFATVALQHPDLAVEQLEEGVKKLGLRGASVGGSVNGEELSSEKFHPFWAKAEELGVLVFMHPQGVPDLRKRLQGNGMLTNVIGNPLETTIALSHLIFEGTLDRFPGLKLCAAHGGGYLPSYADRSDHGCLVFPQNCNSAMPKKHPTEYLRQLYFDALIFTPEALRHLVAQCGVSQIVMGTDSPIGWTNVAVDHILGTPSLSNADKIAILGGNAARLLRIAS
jgi:predicted TIM-barrel fold metal-dependent hydrolase